MKLRYFIGMLCICLSPISLASDKEDVGVVLDAFHKAAAEADATTYFDSFTPDGVFIGTDAKEVWTVAEFRAYAEPYFSKGRGWTYVSRNRHIYFSQSGNTAWFDELLDNASYGETRGTGVLEKMDGQWKIAQYHLTIPVPNAIAGEVVKMIKAESQE